MLRNIIFDLVPPVLLRPAQLIWRRAHGVGWYTFEGNWPKLSDVPSGPGRYDDDDLASEIARLGLPLLAAPARKRGDHQGRLILPIVVSQIAERPLTVLDFGGGACTGLRFIRAHIPDFNTSGFRYVLVETQAVCWALAGKVTYPGVTIGTEIPAAIDGDLVVNITSVIQYIDNYRSTLRRLAALKPSAIIISLTPFTNDPTFACCQCNMPHKRVASWVFNRAELVSIMAGLGFTVSFAVDYDVAFTHKNAPGPYVFGSMIFRPMGA